MMKSVNRIFAVIAALVFVAGLIQAQAKKSYTFHGKVEAVDDKSSSLRVNGEKVEGWMSAMTMDYKVDDPSVLKKLKAGDEIMATVYDGDYTLHKVQVKPKPGSDEKSKK
jgi:Cu/Ag efflux protein CusF